MERRIGAPAILGRRGQARDNGQRRSSPRANILSLSARYINTGHSAGSQPACEIHSSLHPMEEIGLSGWVRWGGRGGKAAAFQVTDGLRWQTQHSGMA